jgi:TetR/AcrR family fatty acid metabolism transcriptional regulator
MAKQKRIGVRKEQILKAAERVFAKKGFQQATISEIAREANVSDATIYEYFPTKEELLFSIPFETTRKGKKDLLLHLSLIRGAANKLRALIYWYLHFFEHHPDYGSVVLLILKSNREFLKTDTYQVVREWARLFVDIVKEGIESGEFKSDIDPYLVRSVILGTIEHSVISWLLLGRPKDLLALVDPLTDLVVEGVNNKDTMNMKGWNINITLEQPKHVKGSGESSEKNP